LIEQNNTTYVYTSQDSDGTLSGEVEVTTGLSDGTNVEITNGLSEGDTVYYTKISSSDSSTDSFDFGNMDKGGMGGGKMDGEMPSGGDMPSGGGGDMPSGGGSDSGKMGGGPGGNN
jgi:hypothetical protein